MKAGMMALLLLMRYPHLYVLYQAVLLPVLDTDTYMTRMDVKHVNVWIMRVSNKIRNKNAKILVCLVTVIFLFDSKIFLYSNSSSKRGL